MEKQGNKYFFNNDDEFYIWAVVPELKILKGKVCLYTDFDFTDECQKAIDDGIEFVICDKNSIIGKDGYISYRTITKHLDNISIANELYRE